MASLSDRKVLVTGFEPFDGERINPSQEVLHRLHGWRPKSPALVHTLSLPCVFGDALAVLDEALQALKPSVVIALGQAAKRHEVSVERMAINIDDARIPDNAGRQPVDEPVVPDAPAAYFSSLPIKAIVHALREAHIPAEVSQSAGTFVCNHVFYGLMHHVSGSRRRVRAGFIHLPCLPEQVTALRGGPGLPLDTMVQAVQIAVETSLRVRADLHESGGALD